MKKKVTAYIKSNVWGNYYVMISGKKVYDIMGKRSNIPEIIEWITAHYPDAYIVDKTQY